MHFSFPQKVHIQNAFCSPADVANVIRIRSNFCWSFVDASLSSLQPTLIDICRCSCFVVTLMMAGYVINNASGEDLK